MGKCLIEVRIRLVDCDGSEDKIPVQIDDGSFKMVISEDDAVSIDNCEAAVLRTTFPAVRDIIPPKNWTAP